jgi:biotin operon repressor
MTKDTKPPALTIKEIADLKGLSRQAIQKNVATLEKQGLLTCKRSPKGAKLIDVEEYDRLAERHLHPGRVAAWQTRRDGSPQESQASKVRYEAELKKLDLLTRRRDIVPITGAHGVASAAGNAASAIVRVIDGLPSRAADMVAAVNKDGVHGARTLLRSLAFEIRKTITAEMTALARHGQELEATGNLGLDFALS